MELRTSVKCFGAARIRCRSAKSECSHGTTPRPNKDPYIITFPCPSDLLDFNRYLKITDSDPNTETTNSFLLGHRPNNFIAPMFDRLALPALCTLRISSAIPFIDPAISGEPFIYNTYLSKDFGLI